MVRIVTFLTLLSHLRFARGNFRTCVPNTQFMVNDRICYCDGKGQWSEASCLYVGHRQLCQPGQIVWHGCSQCVCQDNGQLLCNNLNCPGEAKSVPTTKSINSIGHWCTPFRIYYIDCNICVCPESGRTATVQCVKDTSCTALRTPSVTDLLASNKNTCKPKVLYVFSCLQCLCSDEGYFLPINCVETCPSEPKTGLKRTCTPHSFYRNDCNVCLCPSNGLNADASCTQEVCDGKYKFKALQSLTSDAKQCTAHHFTPPQCLYCHCNPEGTINQETCLELNCLNTHFKEYNIRSGNCTPGEMVPFCTECFCLRNGTTHHEYCTKGCSYPDKIQVFEKVFKDSKHQKLLDLNALDTTADALTCKLNSIYTENGKYCLCPDTETKEKSCFIATNEGFNFQNPASQLSFKEMKINIDFKKPCTPSAFVEFDCNTCFCSKNGTIDPKWCTYDDCDAKRKILDNQKAQRLVTKTQSETCRPGSITEVDCNFCICPDNGLSKDKACTKNRCSEVESAVTRENFDCNPLDYYEVDCNICACPRDGIKNVAKCTKNICEDNFLRSDACVPGRLFSEECNICICPPTGTKKDRICTMHNCKKAETTWKRIFKFTNSIIEDYSVDGAASAKKLDLCFPGEEFITGGQFCVCPEMGLRTYATCSEMVLDEGDNRKEKRDEPNAELNTNFGIGDSFAGSDRQQQQSQQQQQNQQQQYLHEQPRYEQQQNQQQQLQEQQLQQNQQQQPQEQQLQQNQQQQPSLQQLPQQPQQKKDLQPQQQPRLKHECYIYNTTSTATGTKCTTGSLYIKGCQQCICPFVGDNIEFCRTLNSNQCIATGITSYSRNLSTVNNTIERIALSAHEHTQYKCAGTGIVKDACHVCECEKDSVIREHCFSSTSIACTGVEPTFLRDKL